MRDFGDKIKELRLAKRMSQAELGDVLGVTRAAVQQWESNTTRPALNKLSELARFFDISLADLMGAPQEHESVDGELRELPEDIAIILKQAFLAAIRAMKAIKRR
jgi:transcriptional regulator with XRE-family HTH domain